MTAVLAITSIYSLGMIGTVIGAFKLELARSLDIDNARVGGLISVMTFTSMVVSLVLGVLVDTIGYRPVAASGFVLAAISVYMLVSARKYGSAVFACFIMGTGWMSLMTFGNNLITRVLFDGLNPSAALNFGHVFGALGALTPPLVIGLFVRRFGFRHTGNFFTVLLLIPLPFVLFTVFPDIHSRFVPAQALVLLSNPAVIIFSCALFCYGGIESSFSSWITTYANSLKFTDRAANITLSIFWLSLMGGRLAAAMYVSPLTETAVLITCIIIVVLVLVILVKNEHKGIATAAVIVAGFTLGPMFPIIAGKAVAKVDPLFRGSAFGVIFAAGVLGGSTIPALIGIHSRSGKHFRKSLVIPLAVACTLCAILMSARHM
ncbi:MFS transporter [bacterium]|nr:MFS transporter [bacterium]